jgi:colanic acid/amylovoran biosynthesis glycosyltransferase
MRQELMTMADTEQIDSLLEETPVPENQSGGEARPSPRGRRLAYLLSAYPAVSHTFFLNEIVELRKLGFRIDVASINRPRTKRDDLSETEAEALDTTFYIKAAPPIRILLSLLKTILLRPAAVARGLAAALRLDPWNLRASVYALLYLAEALILGDWLRERGHRHLHIHFGGPVATVGMLASAAWKIPFSLTIHGPDEFYDVGKFYLARKIERAQFVLCISDYCRSQIMKIADPVHWSKLHVVRLGVDGQRFLPRARKERKAELEIVCVGRLVPAKGQLILLRAFSTVRSLGYGIRLRLIGDGVDRPALESFIRVRALDDAVTLDGALPHEAIRQRLAEADIFVLPSFAEGLPIALMEAMAMEVPCISTVIAGIPELIRSGIDGLLVPSSSEKELGDAIERLILDPQLRQSLAISARRRVLEHYDLCNNVACLADCLRSQLT